MTFVIDIDDTIIFSRSTLCAECGGPVYREEKIDFDEVRRINNAYEKGHQIIVHTGRDWLQFEVTQKQLDRIGMKYHRLIMGKPHGIYIDKDSKKSLSEVEGV
jgi:hydroxymethylpyrimidine pyrophosphatase-like HAD family hydrolase